MEDVKSYREKELVWYILAYLLLLISIFSPKIIQNWSCINDIISDISSWLSSILLIGVISALSFVFTSLYPEFLREKLVYFKRKIPGKQIFSNIKFGLVTDIRINSQKALLKYEDIMKNIPSNKKDAHVYENNKWYDLYDIHIEDSRVLHANRDYLLSLDMYLTTITMSILTAIAFVLHLFSFNFIITGYLLIMLILTNIVTRLNAKRLVLTVIAVDLTACVEKTES